MKSANYLKTPRPNRRDYAAAERYWSPHCIRHSAHIAPGREGRNVRSFLKSTLTEVSLGILLAEAV